MCSSVRILKAWTCHCSDNPQRDEVPPLPISPMGSYITKNNPFEFCHYTHDENHNLAYCNMQSDFYQDADVKRKRPHFILGYFFNVWCLTYTFWLISDIFKQKLYISLHTVTLLSHCEGDMAFWWRDYCRFCHLILNWVCAQCLLGLELQPIYNNTLFI